MPPHPLRRWHSHFCVMLLLWASTTLPHPPPESRCLLLLLPDALQTVVGALVPLTAAQPRSPGGGRRKLESPGRRSGAATPLAEAIEAEEDDHSRRGQSGGR